MRLPAGTGCVNRGWRSARQATRTMLWHDRDCVMPDPLSPVRWRTKRLPLSSLSAWQAAIAQPRWINSIL
jgi:hypothetical protein